jgi:hypothetical protein
MIQLLATVIDERTKPADLERIRRNLVEAIRELQLMPGATARHIKDVELASGVNTPIAHKLGRPVFVTVSPVRGPSSTGRIEEVRDTDVTRIYPRSEFVVLVATGWGATITVDLKVEAM